MYCMVLQVNKDVDPTTSGAFRTSSSSLRQIINIRSQTLEVEKNFLRTNSGLRECNNPLLMLPADLFQ